MTAQPRHLTRIRLELARTAEHPDGSRLHGYELVAPLDAAGHLDADAWKSSWAFRYDIDGDEDDEAGYRLAQHSFNLGDYVSVRDEDGNLHTFRVVAAETVPV